MAPKKPTRAERIEANILRKVANALRGAWDEGYRGMGGPQDGDDVPSSFDAVRAAKELEAHAKQLDGDPQSIDVCPVARCGSWIEGIDPKELFEGDVYCCKRGHCLRVVIESDCSRLVWDGKKQQKKAT